MAASYGTLAGVDGGGASDGGGDGGAVVVAAAVTAAVGGGCTDAVSVSRTFQVFVFEFNVF